MLSPQITAKSIEISSSESESNDCQSSMTSNQEGFDFPSKKKRIVRKKYKPRKKDIFIHTICVINKNNFRAQNSIIETFLIPEVQQGTKHSRKSVQSTIEKTNEEYLRKLRENIKFTQSLNEKKPNQLTLPFRLGHLQTSLTIQAGSIREEPPLKWLERGLTSQIPPLLAEFNRLNRGLALFK